MGFASYWEDIQRRLREQRTSFDSNLRTIRRWVSQQTPSNMKDIETLKDIEERVRESLVRIDCVVEETANKVLAIFDEAEKRLHDPNVRIVKQLDKAKSYAQALRTELADAKSQLEKCRSKGTSLNEMISSLKVELVVAKRENARLAQKTDWVAEVGPVKPIRRR